MYTTNVIEWLNRQYRKVTKTKSIFPTDISLEKMLYLATQNATKKWTQRYGNWDRLKIIPNKNPPILHQWIHIYYSISYVPTFHIQKPSLTMILSFSSLLR